jgi:hypothetical protein
VKPLESVCFKPQLTTISFSNFTWRTCGDLHDPTGSAAVYHWKNDGENSEKRMQRMKLLKI